MRAWLQSLYSKLPIIRELRETNRQLASHLEVIERAAQESYLLALLSHERYRDEKRLSSFEHKVYSQNGEDGIIAEIFRRIGTESRTFVELGVGNGLECNTSYLLTQGWRGVWVEGDRENAVSIRANCGRYLQSDALRFLETVVTRENIEGALCATAFSTTPDLFSLDLDRNTYHVWESLGFMRPRVVAVEYNATYPPEFDWKVEYDANAWWDTSFHYGASLKAYELLGRSRGYSLVGCDLAGTNAFFVRDDLIGGSFAAPFTAENHYEPPRYWLVRRSGHLPPDLVV